MFYLFADELNALKKIFPAHKTYADLLDSVRVADEKSFAFYENLKLGFLMKVQDGEILKRLSNHQSEQITLLHNVMNLSVSAQSLKSLLDRLTSSSFSSFVLYVIVLDMEVHFRDRLDKVNWISLQKHFDEYVIQEVFGNSQCSCCGKRLSRVILNNYPCLTK